MLKISRDRLIFNMRILIHGEDGLYIETGSRSHNDILTWKRVADFWHSWRISCITWVGHAVWVETRLISPINPVFCQLIMMTSEHGKPFWSPVDPPHKGPIMSNFCVFFDVNLKRALNKQWICRWFETPWRSCDMTVLFPRAVITMPMFYLRAGTQTHVQVSWREYQEPKIHDVYMSWKRPLDPPCSVLHIERYRCQKANSKTKTKTKQTKNPR